ncbi:MAG: hypothetical protein K5988_03570 [Lachnospiraceae bacterium]|nr:hypothetical protein [Lachnospiraceae bacterium]
MKQKLTHNLNLKVLAVLFSIIIWVIVVNIDDPVKTVQFNDVPITLANELSLTDQKLVCEFKDGKDTVDVTVTGRRSVIEDLSKDNISVIADLKELTKENTVVLKVASNKYSGDIDNMKCDDEFAEFNIEELVELQKAIQVETIGIPADDYITGDFSVNLNRIKITGPKSVIDKVQSAKVQIDVEGATNNVSASVPIILYDAVGDRVDSSRLKLNIDNINVNQEILYTKKIPVNCNPLGDPEEGYKMTGKIDIDPAEVYIAGPKSVLDNINSVTIYSSAVNISDQNSDYVTTVNIFNYLPNGVEAASKSFSGNVTVSVEIEKELSKDFNIYLSKVGVDNLPEGLEAEILNGYESAADNKIEVTVYGLARDIENISSTDIKVEADFDQYLKDNNFTSMSPGVFTVPLKITLPNGLRTDDKLKLRIRITESET